MANVNDNLAVAALGENASDRSKIALVWEGASGRREVYTFFEIDNLSNRIANVLKDLGTKRGDRIFTLLNRTPELYATIPAVLKTGAAVGILFSDFGAEAIRQRLEDAGARMLITDSANLEKIRHVCEFLPNLAHILIVGDANGAENFPEATRACFRAGWYITRDRGKMDKDGYFWFVARNDDVIMCQAQRIGPFEVENALLSHPAIAESAAVGAKNEITTEHVKAFVVLRKEFASSRRLAEEIAACVRALLSPLATPREIEFCADLPKTRSGKIRRDRLRRRKEFDTEKVFVIE